jgi:hypothetical protein
MPKKKKRTGKGHTLYDDDPPKGPEDLWVLLSESCYEISKTLLSQDSYAKSITVYFAEFQASLGAFEIFPLNFPRYPQELYHELRSSQELIKFIESCFSEVRRCGLFCDCKDYQIPLFSDENPEVQMEYELLEGIRQKERMRDIIGHGYEGLRSKRIQTYTQDQPGGYQHALKLLKGDPILKKLAELSGICLDDPKRGSNTKQSFQL